MSPLLPPEQRRARLITTYEGRFVNLNDVREALNDDDFIRWCSHMLKVGQERGDPTVEILRRTIGFAIFSLSGDLAKYPPAKEE